MPLVTSTVGLTLSALLDVHAGNPPSPTTNSHTHSAARADYNVIIAVTPAGRAELGRHCATLTVAAPSWARIAFHFALYSVSRLFTVCIVKKYARVETSGNLNKQIVNQISSTIEEGI